MSNLSELWQKEDGNIRKPCMHNKACKYPLIPLSQNNLYLWNQKTRLLNLDAIEYTKIMGVGPTGPQLL